MTVTHAGKKLYEGTPARTAATMIKSLVGRGDPKLMFDAVVGVEVGTTAAAGPASRPALQGTGRIRPVTCLVRGERPVYAARTFRGGRPMLALTMALALGTNPDERIPRPELDRVVEARDLIVPGMTRAEVERLLPSQRTCTFCTAAVTVSWYDHSRLSVFYSGGKVTGVRRQ